MQTNRVISTLKAACVALGLLSIAFCGLGQTTFPTVTVAATGPNASFCGTNTGTFTFYRAGDTNAALRLFCFIQGTATNGYDYVMISNFVVIPAGVRSSNVVITAIDHGQTVVKTVEVQLAWPFLAPQNYRIGYPSNATVHIAPCSTTTNFPPTVTIVATDPIAVEGTNCWPWFGPTNSTPAWSNWSGTAATCRIYTNCGPKNAIFTVRRMGATNSELAVNYATGGTASNGVDYVALPGTVTIPAGQRSAQITIVPRDDGRPDITTTVILKIKPDTNYFIGFPGQAGALILDPPLLPPSLTTGVLPDKCFLVNASGPDGAWFHVEYTTDLTTWTPICTSQVVHGSIDFVDPDAAADEQRFYRLVPEANPPAE